MSRLVYLTICLLLMLLLHLQWSLQIITMPRYMLNRSGDILCAFKFPSSKLCGGPYGMNDRYGSNCTATGSLLWICVMFTLFSHCPGKQMLLKVCLQKAGIPILNLQPLPFITYLYTADSMQAAFTPIMATVFRTLTYLNVCGMTLRGLCTRDLYRNQIKQSIQML